MATTSTIGTAARNYSTIQTWHDAFTTGGWIGECYNDSEFTSGVAITLTGKTTSATDFITLRCATGQSFKDNVSVQTNALRYNQTNGVAVRTTGGYINVIQCTEDYTTVTGLQIKNAVGGGNAALYGSSTSTTHSVYESLIVDGVGGGAAVVVSSGKLRNSLIIVRNAGQSGFNFSYPVAGTTVANCTVVAPTSVTSTAAGIGHAGGSNGVVKNTAIFGFNSTFGGTVSSSSSNNASDKTISAGTSNQASLTYANQFVDISGTTSDFKTKTGAGLLDNGLTDTTNVPAAIDIVGTARPQGTAWDIGAWELVATVSFTYFDMAQPTQPSRQPVDLIAY